jgi:hypothetical protein
MSGSNSQISNSRPAQILDQQSLMAALHPRAPLEHQRYSEQSYEDLFHQPFQRSTTNHDGFIYHQNHHTSLNLDNELSPFNHHQAEITQINHVQEAERGLIDLNQDHQAAPPPLIDNRPSINQNNMNQNNQLQRVPSLPNQVNSSLNINQNNQVLVPRPQRALAPTDISSTLPTESTETSTMSQPGRKKASQTKKSAS